MNSLKVCRICLATGLKTFEVGENRFSEAYKEITNMVSLEETLPSFLCWECAHRLQSFATFKTKVLKSRRLLLDILDNEHEISMLHIASVDRKWNNLTSSLNVYHSLTNHFDLVAYEEDSSFVKTECKDNDILVNGQTNGDTDEMGTNKNDFPLGCSEEKTNIELSTVKSEGDSEDLDNNVNSEDEFLMDKIKQTNIGTAKKKVRKRRIADNTHAVVKRYRKAKHPMKKFKSDKHIETKFIVRSLTNEEQIAELEMRAQTHTFKNALHKCTFCYKTYISKENLDNHMFRHSPKIGPYECFICKCRSRTKAALRKHLTALHSREYQCKECGFIAKSRGVARQHLKWHMGVTYQCTKCFAIFRRMTTFMSHRRLVHPSDSVCELCGYTFVNENGVAFHKKMAHRDSDLKVPEDGPYCQECEVRFATKEAHERHLNLSSRHVSEVESNRQSNDSSKKHLPCRRVQRRPKGDPRPYNSRKSQKEDRAWPKPCELCDVPIADQKSYNKHFKREHRGENRTVFSTNTPSLCEHCGRMFAHVTVLKDHMWVHTGIKQVKCNVCHKEFRNKSYLSIHQGMHSSDRRKYDCQVCGMSFTQAGNRSRHMATTHIGVKQYKCDVCEKTFTTNRAKSDHVDHVHLKKPWPKRVRPPRRKNTS